MPAPVMIAVEKIRKPLHADRLRAVPVVLSVIHEEAAAAYLTRRPILVQAPGMRLLNNPKITPRNGNRHYGVGLDGNGTSYSVVR